MKVLNIGCRFRSESRLIVKNASNWALGVENFACSHGHILAQLLPKKGFKLRLKIRCASSMGGGSIRCRVDNLAGHATVRRDFI